MKTTLVQAIMQCWHAANRCREYNNAEWYPRWVIRLQSLYQLLPSGSGVDNGTQVRDVQSWKLSLNVAFHHMDDSGMYDGWSNYVITVRPDWDSVRINVSGPDRNGTKEYLAQLYHATLTSPVEVDETTDLYKFSPP